MSAQNTNGTDAATPQVVGTIHSPGSLRRALRLRPGQVDFLELRVDHFAEKPETLLKAAPDLPAPLIVTVRHPAEGGANDLPASRREALYRQFLPLAAYVDLEVRSTTRLATVLGAAREKRVKAIISDHHFRRTPSARVLRERRQLAEAAGAVVVKVAGYAATAADLERLLELLQRGGKAQVSLMGMGPLGKVSRLLFAQLGSVLNYGFLHEPQVSGQWEATLLKQRLSELATD